VGSDRPRGIDSKLKEGRFRLDIRKKILHHEGGETLEEVAQRSCGCPLPGSAEDQVGWRSDQLGLVEDVPTRGREVGTT